MKKLLTYLLQGLFFFFWHKLGSIPVINKKSAYGRNGQDS
jgi:hypothetical protein